MPGDLADVLYRVSLLLLAPVLALLTACFLWTVWQAGEALHDLWRGRRHRRTANARQLRTVGGDDADPAAVRASLEAVAANRDQHPVVRRFAREVLDELSGNPRTLPARLDHLAGVAEGELTRDVNRVRALVRLGPSLGLAGTLIPLGPGLLALSEGDLGTLAGQLVLAFSTTVIGLLIGGVGYVVALSRAHLADRLAADLDLTSRSVALLLTSTADAAAPAPQGPDAEGPMP